MAYACFLDKNSFNIRLIYWENERSSASARIFNCSIISVSRVMLTFVFNGFISMLLFCII